ncbi:hypothetical protein [Streptomyces sirii]|uniref:hypothetical protein n=1 Tax=Streptomyces sirii TaxID=3127701 RepID=UPI003D360118
MRSRIHRQLRREGVHAVRCTVERLMREDDLEGVICGQRRRTAVPEPSAPRPPALANRRFEASRPNQLWVAGSVGLARGGVDAADVSCSRAGICGKRTRVIGLYTCPPNGATVICADELGPVIPRTFPSAPG